MIPKPAAKPHTVMKRGGIIACTVLTLLTPLGLLLIRMARTDAAAVERCYTALEALRNGNWLIACMGKGNWTSSGHYVVAYGYENGMVYINDPASTKASRVKNTWNLFKSQVKYYWVVEVPESVKRFGSVRSGSYRQEDFVREVQFCIGTKPDEKAGSMTLNKTVTVSKSKNRTHYVVMPLQKLFKKQGRYTGTVDKVAGKLFESAVNSYQSYVMKYAKTDGEITAKGKMWKSLLGMK